VFTEPVPASEFVIRHDFRGLGVKPCLIGHTRYSTSDLEYNQPIFSTGHAIAHNGVITQKDPSQWENEYGLKCDGRNDSELILKCIEKRQHPLEKFKGSSIAVVHLDLHCGTITAYRNGQRPLWYVMYDGVYYFASTQDILFRAFNRENIEIAPKRCAPGRIYSVNQMTCTPTYDSNNIFVKEIETGPDLQIPLSCSDYYIKVKL